MRIVFLVFLALLGKSYAFSVSDFFLNPNQQGQKLMQQQNFKEAEKTFTKPDWRATAAYRAGDFKTAAQQYNRLQNSLGFYNEGNALAHMGKLKEAIQAYDKALAIDPKHSDALYNRKIVADLLKQQEQKDKDSKTEQQNQDKKNQEGKDLEKNTSQQKQNDGSEKKQDQQQNQNQNQKSDSKEQPAKNQSAEEKKSEEQTVKPENSQEKQNQKQEKTTKPKEEDNIGKKPLSPQEKEAQQAKNQWLRLVPDDPGGLLREKFIRDHLRREGDFYP